MANYKDAELYLAEMVYCGLSEKVMAVLMHKPEDKIKADIKRLMKRTKTKTRKEFRKKLTIMKKKGVLYAHA